MDAPFPDSPESVALALFFLILHHEAERHANDTRDVFAAWSLDLFSECLAAARGDRGIGERLRRH